MRLWWESSRHLLVEADPEAPPALSPHGRTWPARRPLPQQPQGRDGRVLHSHLLPSRPCSQVVPREVDRCACSQETLTVICCGKQLELQCPDHSPQLPPLEGSGKWAWARPVKHSQASGVQVCDHKPNEGAQGSPCFSVTD